MEKQIKKGGDGLINPNSQEESKKKAPKKTKIYNDGLMEREENKVLTEDGRELLTEQV